MPSRKFVWDPEHWRFRAEEARTVADQMTHEGARTITLHGDMGVGRSSLARRSQLRFYGPFTSVVQKMQSVRKLTEEPCCWRPRWFITEGLAARESKAGTDISASWLSQLECVRVQQAL
jgi:hypothetical protein